MTPYRHTVGWMARTGLAMTPISVTRSFREGLPTCAFPVLVTGNQLSVQAKGTLARFTNRNPIAVMSDRPRTDYALQSD